MAAAKPYRPALLAGLVAATALTLCGCGKGGHANGLQARGAEAVDGHARGGDRQTGQEARLARDVAAAVRDVAHEHVLDGLGLDAGLGDRVLHGVGGNGDGGGNIESATGRFGQAGAGVRDNDSFAHFK